MAEYCRKKVVEISITAGFGMTACRFTLNGKVIETASHNTSRTLLSVLTSAVLCRKCVDGT